MEHCRRSHHAKRYRAGANSPHHGHSLLRKFFEVGGELVKNKSGTIYAPVSVPAAPLWNRLLTPCAVVCGAGLLALLFLILFTAPALTAICPAQQELRSAVKKYGERIVRTDGEVSLGAYGTIYVKSLEDLVRLADELGKPVVCREEPLRESATFVVFDGALAYAFEFGRETTAGRKALTPAVKENLAASS